MDIRTDWELILERFNFNYSAIAKAIEDNQGLPKKRTISHVRVDIESLRFGQYTRSVLFLLQLGDKQVHAYQKRNPPLASRVDIGIAVTQAIKALEPVTDREEVLALLRADENIEQLIQIVYAKLGGGIGWAKVIRGECDGKEK